MARSNYPYAVLRRLDPEDQRQAPHSCHLSADAAVRAAARYSAQEQRYHGHPGAYVAVHWDDTRWAREPSRHGDTWAAIPPKTVRSVC